MSVPAVYRSYDDPALALLANAGLVRRAAKVLAGGEVQGDPQQTNGEAVDVTVAGVVVRLAATGPAACRCPCPATGVCVHILAASMWARAAPGSAGAADSPVVTAAVPAAETSGDQAADPLAALLESSSLALCREAGIAVVRRAVAYLAALDPDLPPTEARADAGRVVITVGEHDAPMHFVPGAGLAGMVSGAPEADRLVVHLAALARVFAVNGQEWTWPATTTGTNEASFEAVHGDSLALLNSALASLLASGLSHVGVDDAERVTAIAVRLRAEGLPLLARLLTTAGGLLTELADRRDDVSERDVALALAHAWALAAALVAAPADQRAALTGIVRREFSDTTELELVPLGALWWTTATGARGVTIAVADRATGVIELVSSARPAGADPTFRQSDHVALAWGASIAHLAAGPFRLRGPRRAADGSLAAGGSGASVLRDPGSQFDEADLRAVAIDRWRDGALSTAAAQGFGRLPETGVLLAPAAVGDIRIDETAQQLVWPLVDVDGAVIEARVDVTPTTSRRIDALLALGVSRSAVEFVLVQVGRHGGTRTIEPSGVFVREKSGLSLVIPDFSRVAAPASESRLRALRTRFDRLLTAPPVALVASAPASFAERICLPVLDVLEEICATGRLTITDRQRGILTRHAELASDVALASVESAIRPLLSSTPVTAPALYRCLFVVERAMAVTG